MRLSLTSGCRGWFATGLVTCAALLVLAAPADARRKFGGSSSKSSSSTPSGAAPAAKMSGFNAALIGMQVHRATSNKLRKVFELPVSKANTLPDGRHIHIGEVTRFLLGGRYVGWISRQEFVEVSKEHLAALLFSAGFNDVAEFEKHLAEVGPTKDKTGAIADKTDAQADAVGQPEPTAGYSSSQLAILAAGALSLLGFVGFCFISWRSNREANQKTANAVAAISRSARTTRVSHAVSDAATPAAAVPRPARPLQTVPVARAATAATSAPTAERPSTIPRRAPRNLGTLVIKPA